MPKTKAKTKDQEDHPSADPPPEFVLQGGQSKRQQQVHDGELCAPGAWEDMERVARLIRRLGSKLTDIHITMDSRHLLHISHPLWFRDAQDHHPEPFTVMQEKEGAIVGGRMDVEGNLLDTTEYLTTIPHLLSTYPRLPEGDGEGQEVSALHLASPLPHWHAWARHRRPGHASRPRLVRKGSRIPCLCSTGSNYSSNTSASCVPNFPTRKILLHSSTPAWSPP